MKFKLDENFGFLQTLTKMSLENNLWVVETTRIRIHQTQREQ